MRRHDEPLRGGATVEDGPGVDRRQAQQVADRIEARDGLGLPVHHPPAVEAGWW